MVPALLACATAAAGATPEPATRPLETAPAARWQHRLVWTLSSDEVLFGRISDVIRLADGTVAAADAQLGQVLLVPPGSSSISVLAVAGGGPGRVERLTGIGETADGDLVLVQAWPGRAEVIARDGTPVRSLRLARSGVDERVVSLLRLVTGRRRWLGLLAEVRHESPLATRTVLRLAWLDPEDLAREGVLVERQSVVELRQGFVDETSLDLRPRAFDLLPDGRAVLAPAREAYALAIHAPGGGPVDRLASRRVPLARPEAEKNVIRRAFALTVNGRAQRIEFRFFETAAAIQAVAALDDGRAVVSGAHCFHRLPPGSTLRLDLVDPAAATVSETLLDLPFRAWVDALVVLPDRDLIVVRHGFGGFDGAGPAAAAGAEAHGVPSLEYWTFQGETP